MGEMSEEFPPIPVMIDFSIRCIVKLGYEAKTNERGRLLMAQKLLLEKGSLSQRSVEYIKRTYKKNIEDCQKRGIDFNEFLRMK